MHIDGLLSFSFQNTASIIQASLHKPQPMHLEDFNLTPPPSFGVKAPVGQTAAHGGFSQERHTITLYPLEIPPADFTPIQVFPKPAFPLLLEQANIQLWQPTHLIASFTASFITGFLKFDTKIQKIDSWSTKLFSQNKDLSKYYGPTF